MLKATNIEELQTTKQHSKLCLEGRTKRSKTGDWMTSKKVDIKTYATRVRCMHK
jgi:hypothetical protein